VVDVDEVEGVVGEGGVGGGGGGEGGHGGTPCVRDGTGRCRGVEVVGCRSGGVSKWWGVEVAG
jgi:hypothetical protein